MHFLRLPNEILLHISSYLIQVPKDFLHLLTANHHLYFLLLHRFHQLALSDKDGQSALHWAAKRGHVPLALLLLKNNVNINLRNNTGSTALSKAIEYHHPKIVQVLLDHGADVNLQDNKGTTALHWAVYTARKTSNNAEALITLLISKGARIDHQDYNMMTPLYLAMARLNVPLVRLLLSHGADLLLQTNRGYDGIRRAVMNNDKEMVEMFLEQQGVDVNHQDEDGKTALHAAASLTIRGETWDLEGIIRLLIEKGGDVTIRDNCGMRPGGLVKGASKEIRKLLEPVGKGKDHPLDRSKNTPNHIAVPAWSL